MKPSTEKPQEDLHTNEVVCTNQAAHEAEQNASPVPTSSMIYKIYIPLKDAPRILNDEKRGTNYLTASFGMVNFGGQPLNYQQNKDPHLVAQMERLYTVIDRSIENPS